MVSIKEVPADKAISEIKEVLKKETEIAMPEWAKYAKTGPHVERKPEQSDWWHIRTASIMRKLYLTPNLGVNRLRTWYGGRKNRGRKPEKHVDAGGKVIRSIMQQLEKAGLVTKQKIGRTLSPKGRSLLDKVANNLKGEINGSRVRKTETKKVKGTAKKAGDGGKKTTRNTSKPAKKTVTKKTADTKSRGKTGSDKDSKSKSSK